MSQTPLIKINDFYLKREDQNTTGSAKDRALSCQINFLTKNKFSSAVISSTGNAAISAAHFCHQASIKLTIFVSPHIDPAKLKYLEGQNLITDINPLKSAFQFAQKNQAYNLRLSQDPRAIQGYQEIGIELTKQIPNISSIFIPTASGTTLLGISQKLPTATKIFAVQPANYCPIASHFDHQFTPESKSITTALSVKHLPLKNQVLKAVYSGLIIQNQKIKDSQEFLKQNQIDTSNEGALALAGFFKAKNIGLPVGEFPVILLTGARR